MQMIFFWPKSWTLEANFEDGSPYEMRTWIEETWTHIKTTS